MLGKELPASYYDGMKKIIYFITGLVVTLSVTFAQAFAIDAEENKPDNHLYFRSVNAGYKDDSSAQNYDFFELYKDYDSDIDLSSYIVEYYNSSDNLAGKIEFDEATILQKSSVVFGFMKSPQYSESPARHLYSFSSSGLASTAGRLRLVLDNEIVDEVCWGKISCNNQLNKFATKEEENYSAYRCFGEECKEKFSYEKYYPTIDTDALYMPVPEQVPIVSCDGLKITEIYAYYENNSGEQYVELLNTSDHTIPLSACSLKYKNKNYPLQGSLESNTYTLVQDILLVKNPSSSITLELLDGNGVIDSVIYEHGQKKGTSVALVDGQ